MSGRVQYLGHTNPGWGIYRLRNAVWVCAFGHGISIWTRRRPRR